MMLRSLVLLLVVCGALSGQTFKKSKMYVEQEHKQRLRKVNIDVQDDALVVTGRTDKYLSTVRIPYVEITAMEYEKSKHRRWKTGILLTTAVQISSDGTYFGLVSC